MASTRKTNAGLASMIAVLLLMLAIPAAFNSAIYDHKAFAVNTNAYMGLHIQGYQGSGGRTWDPMTQFYGYTDFKNTNTAYLTSDLQSIVSTAGVIVASNTISGIRYQEDINLHKDTISQIPKVYHDPQVWGNSGTALMQCFQNDSCAPLIDNFADLDYVYYTALFSADKTTVTFYGEGHALAGHSGAHYNLMQYTRNPSTDASTDFGVGIMAHQNSAPADFYAKLLQVGVESDSAITHWNVHQYGIVYYPDTGAGARNLASDNTFSDWGGTSDIDYYDFGTGSDISWNPSNNVPYTIGLSTYNANADYKLKSGRAAGDILWSDGTQLPAVTALWGTKISLNIAEIEMGAPTHNTDGLSVVVRDSALNVIKSGFTPMNVMLSSGGTYYVDYNNYANWYFTYPASVKPSAIADWNVYNWGGRVQLSLSNNQETTIDGKDYNSNSPGSFAKITIQSQYTTGGSLTGMFSWINIHGTSNTWSKGYTPYIIGISTTAQGNDVSWNNYNVYYQYADTTATETSDTKYSWGGVQQISAATNGGSYTDTGKYSTTP